MRVLAGRVPPSGPEFQLFTLALVALAAGAPATNPLNRAENVGTLCTFSDGSGGGALITTDAVGGWQVGDTIEFLQLGAGTLTVQPDAGVTIRTLSPLTTNLAGQYARAQLVKIAANEWVLSGDLA